MHHILYVPHVIQIFKTSLASECRELVQRLKNLKSLKIKRVSGTSKKFKIKLRNGTILKKSWLVLELLTGKTKSQTT